MWEHGGPVHLDFFVDKKVELNRIPTQIHHFPVELKDSLLTILLNMFFTMGFVTILVKSFLDCSKHAGQI